MAACIQSENQAARKNRRESQRIDSDNRSMEIGKQENDGRVNQREDRRCELNEPVLLIGGKENLVLGEGKEIHDDLGTQQEGKHHDLPRRKRTYRDKYGINDRKANQQDKKQHARLLIKDLRGRSHDVNPIPVALSNRLI